MNTRPSCLSAADRGSALLLVLWALLLLAGAVFAWVKYLDQQIEFTRQSNLGLDARALAYSGLSVALHPQVSARSPLLRQQLDATHGYKVSMRGEGGRLNLNWLLAGEDERKLNLLKDYLARRGMAFRDREVLVDSLLDWVDADNVKRLNGLEEGPDYLAPNRPLQSVEELRQVHGAEPLVAIPGWDKDFTVTSQGPIDLLAANEDVLGVVPGIGDARSERFLQYRRGADGVDYTEDDPVFENMSQVRSFLGLDDAQFKTIAPLVTINDATWRIESVGESAKVYRQLDVVARKVGARAQIFLWKEF